LLESELRLFSVRILLPQMRIGHRVVLRCSGDGRAETRGCRGRLGLTTITSRLLIRRGHSRSLGRSGSLG
ncbi:hypothetical protein PENTCL1PPCAC_17274, partial [Pristionchus entomophagus]